MCRGEISLKLIDFKTKIRQEFILKINKCVCTSIRYTRVQKVTLYKKYLFCSKVWKCWKSNFWFSCIEIRFIGIGLHRHDVNHDENLGIKSTMKCYRTLWVIKYHPGSSTKDSATLQFTKLHNRPYLPVAFLQWGEIYFVRSILIFRERPLMTSYIRVGRGVQDSLPNWTL